MNEDLTLSIIKPNAVRNKIEIISLFEKSNLTIKAKLTTLAKDRAEAFYEEQDKPFLTNLLDL